MSELKRDRQCFKRVGRVFVTAVKAKPIDDGDLLDAGRRGIRFRPDLYLNMIVQSKGYTPEPPFAKGPIGSPVKIGDALRPDRMGCVCRIVRRSKRIIIGPGKVGFIAYTNGRPDNMAYTHQGAITAKALERTEDSRSKTKTERRVLGRPQFFLDGYGIDPVPDEVVLAE